MLFWEIIFRIKALGDMESHFLGHKIRGVFLDIIRERNKKISESIHGASVSPYSLMPLVSTGNKEQYLTPIKIEKGKLYEFRIRLLRKEYFDEILATILTEPPQKIKIDKTTFEIKSVSMKKIEFKPPEIATNKITIIFRTPTYFKSRKRANNVLLPIPEIIVGSAIRLWNQYIKNEYNKEEIEENAKKKLRISKHKIWTIPPITLKNNRKVVGFLGQTTLEILDPKLEELLPKILKLTEITNIGGSRTMGFGVTKIILQKSKKNNS